MNAMGERRDALRMSNLKVFLPRNPGSCRIETESGTVYWLTGPDAETTRSIYRDSKNAAKSSTMKLATPGGGETAIHDRFRGTIVGEVNVGKSVVFAIKTTGEKVLTETVVSIEATPVPSELFCNER